LEMEDSMKPILISLCLVFMIVGLCPASQTVVAGEQTDLRGIGQTPGPTSPGYRPGPVSQEAERAYGFELNGQGKIRLVFENRASPQLQIQGYISGSAQLALIMGCLVATGAGLVFVAPLATVPAAIGPLANAGAGATAVGVASGEAWTIDSLIGKSRAAVLWEAVNSIDLPALLLEALLRHLGASELSREETAGEFDVALEQYGFSSFGDGKVCYSMRLRMVLKMPGREDIEDTILMERGAAGEDMPPPYCTSLGRLLEDEGRLARRTIEESGEIAAAIIAHRAKEGNP
jgi:hypothetical protein